MLTPSQALVLQTITWWIRGSKQKGKDYTSATATQVSKWIAEKFHADVSPKTSQNALRNLASMGWLKREAHKVSGFSTVYRYYLGVEREIHVTVPENHSVEPSSPSLLVKEEIKNQIKKDAQVSEPRPARALAPKSEYRSTGLKTKLEMPHGARSLAQIEELCKRIGSKELPNPSVEPEVYAKQISETR